MVIYLFTGSNADAQACTPAGDQTTYGSSNVWIGYVYSGTNFNTYRGYVTVGTSTNYAFDQNFGGSSVSYPTNGCPVTTEVFSVRYKLTKTFVNETINFTVSGDDGYRLSIDGGATWLINKWNDQSYTSATASSYMNGTYNLVLEYYENSGDNRITFSAVIGCTGAGDPTIYGTNNIWKAYVYEGNNFNAYKGSKTEGATLDANFDESFGGDNVTMGFLTCPIHTENFSARFRLYRHMSPGTYVFTIGGDDGYRLSLDGGSTWVINKWVAQSYNITSYTATLSGNYNMVIEYFENSGGNRISFTMSANLLPVKLTAFTVIPVASNKVQLNWTAQSESDFSKYVIQRSYDGRNFTDAGTQPSKGNNNPVTRYNFLDQPATSGTVYYRLAMHDLDGSVTYSDIKSVVLSTIRESKLFPTVVSGNKIFFESAVNVQQATIEVFDMTGKMVSATKSAIVYGRQELTIDTRNKAKGSYLIRISDQRGSITNKVIIVQ